MHHPRLSSWKRHVSALLLFGTAFGYLEAAVVRYLRYLHEPIRQRFYPGRPAGDLFPLLTQEQAATAGPLEHKVLVTEIGREAATIVMLAGIALAISTNLAQWVAAFVITFGVWDIMFYMFLKVLVDWPASLLTWDVLFLIPVPWVGPVITPVLVSAAMIVAGVCHLRREATGNPVRLGGWNWAGLATGAAVIVVPFTLDARNVMAGGMPHLFQWAIFATGIVIGGLAYTSAALGPGTRQERAATVSAASIWAGV